MAKNMGVVAALLVGAAGGVAQAETVFGITGAAAGGSLVSFDSASPGSVTNVGALSGIVAGHSVRAIDFRPADGQLYALSTSGTSGQLYTVNLGTAALTPVGSGFTVANAFATRVSMDFNPVVDRLRIVTSGVSSNNLRVNPNTGALVVEDGNLAYDAGDVNSGANPPFAVGAAYTNNFAGATSTTLYTWDFNLDVLATIGSVGGAPVSPNAGTMFTVGGPSAFLTLDGGVGFDISSATGTAFFSYNDINTAAETFATIDLATGLPTTIGTFGQGVDLLDISVVIPSPGALGLLGLGGLVAARRRRA